MQCASDESAPVTSTGPQPQTSCSTFIQLHRLSHHLRYLLSLTLSRTQSSPLRYTLHHGFRQVACSQPTSMMCHAELRCSPLNLVSVVAIGNILISLEHIPPRFQPCAGQPPSNRSSPQPASGAFITQLITKLRYSSSFRPLCFLACIHRLFCLLSTLHGVEYWFAIDWMVDLTFSIVVKRPTFDLSRPDRQQQRPVSKNCNRLISSTAWKVDEPTHCNVGATARILASALLRHGPSDSSLSQTKAACSGLSCNSRRRFPSYPVFARCRNS